MGLNYINVYYIAIHRSEGVTKDIRYSVHFGEALGETYFKGQSANVAAGLAAWTYARDHAVRDATWDTKMNECWGNAFMGLSDNYKAALHNYMVSVRPPV